MRFLISVCVVLCCFSCGIPTLKGLHEYKSEQLEFINSYFSDAGTDYIYKTKIKAFGNVFGGILIIKKLKKDNHRIVFTTNFGNKLFDFELLNGGIKTHYIMEELNRKVLINILKHDFETLTKEEYIIHKAFQEDDNFVYQSKVKNRYNHFFVNKKSGALLKIVYSSKFKEITTFKFNDFQEKQAYKIVIEHNTKPLKITLQKF